jgi:hypothetical protein
LNKFVPTRVARRHTKMPAAQIIRGKLIARKFLFVPKNDETIRTTQVDTAK